VTEGVSLGVADGVMDAVALGDEMAAGAIANATCAHARLAPDSWDMEISPAATGPL
jgi:hypothetical protein